MHRAKNEQCFIYSCAFFFVPLYSLPVVHNGKSKFLSTVGGEMCFIFGRGELLAVFMG